MHSWVTYSQHWDWNGLQSSLKMTHLCPVVLSGYRFASCLSIAHTHRKFLFNMVHYIENFKMILLCSCSDIIIKYFSNEVSLCHCLRLMTTFHVIYYTFLIRYALRLLLSFETFNASNRESNFLTNLPKKVKEYRQVINGKYLL